MHSIDGSKIFLNGEEIYVAPTLVRKVLSYQDKLIVLYLWPDEEFNGVWDAADNIVCIDYDGNELWRTDSDVIFRDIKFDDGILWGINSGGWHFRIELQKGQVSKAEYCIADNFKIVGNRVVYNGRDIFYAPGEVNSSVVTNDKNLIILFSGEAYNVLCLDFNGAVKWRVKPIRPLQNLDGYSRWHAESFRGIFQQENKIYLENYNDAKFEINPKTGEILGWDYL
jgi:hypothetical protein